MKRRNFLKTITCSAALATYARPTAAFELPEVRDAEQLVLDFCSLDFNGKRLTSETFTEYQHMLSPHESSGWDELYIISNFKCINSTYDNNIFLIDIEYEVLASVAGEKLTLLEQAFQIPLKKVVTFKVSSSEQKYQILNLALSPHVSLAVAKEFFLDTKSSNSIYSKVVAVETLLG